MTVADSRWTDGMGDGWMEHWRDDADVGTGGMMLTWALAG